MKNKYLHAVFYWDENKQQHFFEIYASKFHALKRANLFNRNEYNGRKYFVERIKVS